MSLTDSCQRPINYLRVSVTDRCNLRCVYCMPPQGVAPRKHAEILRYEEIEQVVRAAVDLGVTHVRLTGGEPLVRLGIVDLVAMLARIPGLKDLAMTTNGTQLARYAADLARAGLKRVNVSLDTLREERYAQITCGGRLADALAGIESAERAGLAPIKINVVVLDGFNADETVDLARLTLEHDWHVRFIELMPLSDSAQRFEGEFVSSEEVRRAINAAWGGMALIPPDASERRVGPSPVHGRGGSDDAPDDGEGGSGDVPDDGRGGNGDTPDDGGGGNGGVAYGSGPAVYYRLPGGRGTVGFISAVSEHFCAQCNRLRLTADGRLRPCLFSDHEIDIKPLLRRGASIQEIQDVLREAIAAKPTGHRLEEHILPCGRVMSEIGG